MKRWILLLLPAATIAVLTGCGGSTFNVQNPQGPPPPNVTVTVQTTGLTNGSVPVNGAVTLTATVQGTSAQVADGVAWYISCSGGAVGACGTLSSPSSASGAAITYTAPASISSNTLTAHIVAYAEAQQTANSISSITITTFNSSLAAGNYVLQAQGADSSLNPYQVAGVIKMTAREILRAENRRRITFHRDCRCRIRSPEVAIFSGTMAGERSPSKRVTPTLAETGWRPLPSCTSQVPKH